MPKTMPVSGNLTGKFPKVLTDENEGVYDYGSFDEQYTGKWYTPCAVADGAIGAAIPVYRKRYCKGITDAGGTDITGDLETTSAINRIIAWGGFTTLGVAALYPTPLDNAAAVADLYGMGLALTIATGNLVYSLGTALNNAADDWQLWVEYTKDTD